MNKRQFCVIACILVCIIILSRCMQQKKEDLRGPAYAGADACIRCHKGVYESYLSTAHYKTSAPADTTSVKGSFSAPDNIFTYAGGQQVVMENRNGKLFQNNTPFDITVGSGTKAQTYLYWQKGQYFQLPLSYFVSAHSWANSPGFPTSHPKFDREIPSTCFGCHSSMVALKNVEAQGLGYKEEFEKNKVLFGIDCERCHGPAAAHVDYHDKHPQEKIAQFITKIGALKNQQQMDLCALCHSGLKTPQRNTFAFRPGDDLNEYFFQDIGRPAKPVEMDVHGTQYQLFTASKCFIGNRRTMSCSSCHNPHVNEKNSRQAFVQRCVSCHPSANHSFTIAQDALVNNCIDCHMPALPSSVKLLVNGKSGLVADSIRTHLITIYPEVTARVLERLK